MFKRPSQRQQLLQRILVSVIALLAILVGVAATVLFILGYRIDLNGRLEQGALLQFESQPGGATVFVDDQVVGRTAGKRTVVAGTHTILFQRDGYEDWSKTLDVKAGTLTWLDYALLIPKNRPVQSVANYQTLAGAKATLSGRTYIIQEKADQPVFQVVDIRSEDVKSTTLTLPVSLYSQSSNVKAKHTFTLKQWDEGGRYMTVVHTFDKKTEWLVIDTQNVTESKNITRSLGINLKDATFASTDGRVLYGVETDGVLRKLDLSAQTISRALVNNVQQFTLDYDTKIISYVAVDPGDSTQHIAGVYRDGDELGHTIRQVPLETPMLIATGRYFSDDYVALTEGKTVTILKGSYPSSSQEKVTSLQPFATLTLPETVQSVSFSVEGDYFFAQAGLAYTGFDIEHMRATSGTLMGDAHTLRWLNGSHLWDDIAGVLTIRDFDGTNAHGINTVAPGFDATLTENNRYVYTIGKRDDGYALQRVKLIVE